MKYKTRLKLAVLGIFICYTFACIGQSKLVLKRPKVYITSAYSIGLAASGYIAAKNVKGFTAQQISSLSVSNLNKWDRAATDNYSITAKNWSDVSLLTTAALPNFWSLNKGIREDFFTYNLIYGQALLSTLGQVMLLKAITKKSRPFAYNSNVAIEERMAREARFSFPSGHTAIAATATYFFATTYSLYFPKSKNRKWVWAGAVVLPLVTGYLRYKAGRHFISDIAGGYTIGAANGVVFPLLFKVGK